MIVFERKARCIVCHLPQAIRDAINRAMWDGQGRPVKFWRRDGMAAAALAERPTSKSVVENHMRHVQESRRRATAERPATDEELPLHHDFQSVTQMAAGLGVKGMSKLVGRLDAEGLSAMEDRDVIAVAKLGVHAVTQQEASRLKNTDQKLTYAALFGLASGHAQIPDAIVRDVTPIGDLRAELAAERLSLTEG